MIQSLQTVPVSETIAHMDKKPLERCLAHRKFQLLPICGNQLKQLAISHTYPAVTVYEQGLKSNPSTMENAILHVPKS